MYFLFKRWPEQLFFVERKDVRFCKAKIPVNFVPISLDNVTLVKRLRDDRYIEQFKYQLDMNDYGLYAFYGDEPIAYGWVKHSGSDDFFYSIGKNVCYLCRFFTRKDFRGNELYPSLISKLIEHETECLRFYIDIEKGNVASEHGLKKIGFRFVEEYKFLRGFKHTFNKKDLF